MKAPKNYLIDMDGVLISGNTLIPGADSFIARLQERRAKFLVLTNNSRYTQRDLAHKLNNIGLPILPESIFTSALATAKFVDRQKPDGTAFVIGDTGLTSALHDVGYILTERDPDYVILGEADHYGLENLTKAIRLIMNGSRFIATNPDVNGPSEKGIVPGCGAVAAMIEKASGIAPFYVGKPNPLMMRSAINALGVHSEDTVMVGDRMDTDVVSGVETGMETILVLSGVTRREQIGKFPYVPSEIYDSVADINP